MRAITSAVLAAAASAALSASANATTIIYDPLTASGATSITGTSPANYSGYYGQGVDTYNPSDTWYTAYQAGASPTTSPIRDSALAVTNPLTSASGGTVLTSQSTNTQSGMQLQFVPQASTTYDLSITEVGLTAASGSTGSNGDWVNFGFGGAEVSSGTGFSSGVSWIFLRAPGASSNTYGLIGGANNVTVTSETSYNVQIALTTNAADTNWSANYFVNGISVGTASGSNVASIQSIFVANYANATATLYDLTLSTPTPEPASLGFGAVASLGLLLRRRRAAGR